MIHFTGQGSHDIQVLKSPAGWMQPHPHQHLFAWTFRLQSVMWVIRKRQLCCNLSCSWISCCHLLVLSAWSYPWSSWIWCSWTLHHRSRVCCDPSLCLSCSDLGDWSLVCWSWILCIWSSFCWWKVLVTWTCCCLLGASAALKPHRSHEVSHVWSCSFRFLGSVGLDSCSSYPCWMPLPSAPSCQPEVSHIQSSLSRRWISALWSLQLLQDRWYG